MSHILEAAGTGFFDQWLSVGPDGRMGHGTEFMGHIPGSESEAVSMPKDVWGPSPEFTLNTRHQGSL